MMKFVKTVEIFRHSANTQQIVIISINPSSLTSKPKSFIQGNDRRGTQEYMAFSGSFSLPNKSASPT